MTSSTQPTFRDGAPCWVDLQTTDLDGARRFYASLFDWTFDPPDPQKGGYVNIRVGDARVAGLMTKQPGDTTPSAWCVWLRSSDVEATARKAAELGGTILFPPHDVGDLGRMLAVIDPAGALLGFWQPGSHRGAGLVNVPGAMCWHEVYTRDAARTDSFYQGLYPYKTSIPPGPPDASCDAQPGMDYRIYNLGDEPVCGRFQMPTAFPAEIPPHWLTYFVVPDVEAAAARVRAHGGKVMHEIMDTPYGRFATVADPFGAVFAINQLPAEST